MTDGLLKLGYADLRILDATIGMHTRWLYLRPKAFPRIVVSFPSKMFQGIG